jgi:hypothetical protein
MAKKPLRSQLNQIRAWVQQGRTDAWIAHQLEVSTAELREFRQRHELSADAGTDEVDLRDEIEAEIEAAMDAEEDEPDDEDEEPEEPDEEEGTTDEETGGEDVPEAETDADTESDTESEGEADGEAQAKRRRRRRGGRGRGRARKALQATFEHGESDGYGLWLDPAVTDDPVYTEHWAGKREVEVSVQPDQIVIKRSS